MGKDINKNKVYIKNKRASFEYEFLEQLTAGMQLTGTEIKSVRLSKANISDAFCTFVSGELFVLNMHISPYAFGNYYNHDPKRQRKLLLAKTELIKLARKKKDVGLTIIPTALFINEKGWAKLSIALCRGKKIHDKREDLKEKDAKREMERVLKK